jgi:signal transduction histidine kinase
VTGDGPPGATGSVIVDADVIADGRQASNARGMQVAAAQLYIPYFTLVVSVSLALATGPDTTAYLATLLGVAGFAALWMGFMRVPFGRHTEHPVRSGIYYLGLIASIAALIVLSPFCGFFGYAGYLHAMLLRGWWKAPAVAGNAVLVALSQIGGVGALHGGGLVGWGALIVVNLAIAGALTYYGWLDAQRGTQREQMIKELDEANRRLQQMMEENAGLHAQLVTQAREAGALDERQRMAGEIHDTLAQGLTGIVAQLEAAQLADDDSTRRRRHMELAGRLARESLAEARRSVQALRPGPLADAQLPEALTHLAEQWNQTSGIPVRVEVDGPAIPLQPALEVTLFRAAQEALANIAKHSGATQAGVTLSYTHDVVVLDVLDNGSGFDSAEINSPSNGSSNGTSYGLSAMRHRLRQVGGSLEIESTAGDGTTVSASVPTLRLEGDCRP